jgi:hypothetical protein
MAGNPRENARGKGFWDGSTSHGSGSQTAGRATGFPGTRRGSRTGIRIDLETPVSNPAGSETDKTKG